MGLSLPAIPGQSPKIQAILLLNFMTIHILMCIQSTSSIYLQCICNPFAYHSCDCHGDSLWCSVPIAWIPVRVVMSLSSLVTHHGLLRKIMNQLRLASLTPWLATTSWLRVGGWPAGAMSTPGSMSMVVHPIRCRRNWIPWRWPRTWGISSVWRHGSHGGAPMGAWGLEPGPWMKS